HTQQRAVGVDHRRGVAIESSGLTLEDWDDYHNLELPGQLLHPIRYRPWNGLRDVEPLAALAGAEVVRVEHLLQADYLGPAARGLPDPDHRPVQCLGGGCGDRFLDDSDREGLSAHRRKLTESRYIQDLGRRPPASTDGAACRNSL